MSTVCTPTFSFPLIIIRQQGLQYKDINSLIITLTMFSNLIGALTALFFTNYCVGLKSDSEIGQLAVTGFLKPDSYMYISQSH